MSPPKRQWRRSVASEATVGRQVSPPGRHQPERCRLRSDTNARSVASQATEGRSVASEATPEKRCRLPGDTTTMADGWIHESRERDPDSTRHSAAETDGISGSGNTQERVKSGWQSGQINAEIRVAARPPMHRQAERASQHHHAHPANPYASSIIRSKRCCGSQGQPLKFNGTGESAAQI